MDRNDPSNICFVVPKTNSEFAPGSRGRVSPIDIIIVDRTLSKFVNRLGDRNAATFRELFG